MVLRVSKISTIHVLLFPLNFIYLIKIGLLKIKIDQMYIVTSEHKIKLKKKWVTNDDYFVWN